MEKKNSVAKTRLCSFFDAGTFVELGAYICREGVVNETEGVVCGYGARNGRLVFAFAQDPDAMKGALDARHAQKIQALYDKAMSVGAPVIGMFDSAGAVVFDGAAALDGYGTLLRVVANASGIIPQIALICGVCTGSMAAVVALFDVTIALKDNARLYVTSPSLLDGKNGTAAYAYEHGNVALLADCEREAFEQIGALLCYLPDHNGALADKGGCTDAPNRALALADRTDAATALATVVDSGTFLEIYGGISPHIKVGFAMLGGVSSVMLAIDGKLTVAGIDKMTRVIRFADAFALPVVTLLNCDGMLTSAADEVAAAGAMARFAAISADLDTAHVVVITGAAVGAGYIFGGNKALGADMVLALPKSEIAALTATQAVAFLYNDRIGKDGTRTELEEKWQAEHATARAAASIGAVDDIVDPAELRARLIAALYMLEGKNGRLSRFL